MWAFIGRALIILVPPANGDTQSVYRWRVAVSSFVLVLSVALSIQTALVWGYFAGTVIGFPGFARADTVSDIFAAVHLIQTSQLDTKILDDQTRFCKAQVTGNGDAMRETQIRLYAELDKWRALTNNEYRLPGCAVMIAK